MSAPVVVEQVWYIYRFWDVDGRLLYIGQTGRLAVDRWLEHLKHQWWADEIVTMQRQTLTYNSLAAVCKAEELAIKAEWPLHNDMHNHRNPNRVIAPPHHVAVWRQGGHPASCPVQPLVRRRTLARWQRHLIGYSALALAVWLGLWWVIAVHLGLSHGGRVSGVMTAGIWVCSWWESGKRRRRRRRWR
jgi:hypothetical protein